MENRILSHQYKSSVWLGILVGWLAQIALKTILPAIMLPATRFASFLTDNPSLWLEDGGDSSHPLWYALQASIFLGSVFAGALAANLSPRKSIAVPVVLGVLSLVATVFEQFPYPLLTKVMLIWMGGPCIGIVAGVLLGRLLLWRKSDQA